MFSKPIIPDPPWKDAYHHLLQASMVVLGLYLGITWPTPETSILTGLGVTACGFFLLTFLYYAPMPCYSPTRLWVIAMVSGSLYLLSGILKSLNVEEIIPPIVLMVAADRLLNHLLAFVRLRRI